MGDDAERPESKAGEPEPPKIKAEDNPWYLLATLYGVPESTNDKLQAKNRAVWNRYFAANLDEKTRTKLINEKRHPAEELTPFSAEELKVVATAFTERCEASAKELVLPASDAEIDLSNVEFQDAFFGKHLFSRNSFRGATFSGFASFDGTTFCGMAYFDRATFSGLAYFGDATFSDITFFPDAVFSEWAIFARASFHRGVHFNSATFSRGAVFINASFSAATYFNGTTFNYEAQFDNATFSGRTVFHDAIFQGSTSFVNVEMKEETSFEWAIFVKEPPRFFGAKLHQGTVWRGITWPSVPKDKGAAGTFVDAYACLKLEMDRLRKHEDELDFFSLELQSRRVLLGRWGWGLPPTSAMKKAVTRKRPIF